MALTALELRNKLVKLDTLSKGGVENDPTALPLAFELLSDVIAWIEAHDRLHFERDLTSLSQEPYKTTRR